LIHLVLAVTIVMTAVMLAAWATQRAAANGGWTDVFWTYGTGLSCAAAALLAGQGAGWRRILVAAMVAVWALRLGTYVARRVAASTEDVRYAYMRSSFGSGFQGKMFGLLIIQGPVTGLLSIAIIYAARQPAPGFRAADLAGLLIMLLAIGGETLADRQMRQFKAGRHGPEAVCDQGLWAFSRHPNYLFEWLGWFAYPVIGLTASNPWSLLSLSAPVLMYAVLRFATGVPPLEAAMLRRKGAAYRLYQENTGAILPRLRRPSRQPH
jgi:steroid 5-alpha reductase family enzyme